MKIIVTGSLGNISKPLAIELVGKGHDVTVISSNKEKQNEIESLGAGAAIGSLDDSDFLTAVFTGADAVYSMIPPNNYFDHNLDLAAYYKKLADSYAVSITQSGVKRLVHLSSIGAHLSSGNGILSSTYVVEGILGNLKDVDVTFMRPTSFYYNLAGYIHGIKTGGAIYANYGTETLVPWVSPIDIAAAIAEELTGSIGTRMLTGTTGRKMVTGTTSTKIRYVASEELDGPDTARILGAAIGKPDLAWHLISDQQALDSLVAIGMNPSIAAGLVEMYGALQSGLLAADYRKNKPAQMGKIKLTDYAKEFAAVYNS